MSSFWRLAATLAAAVAVAWTAGCAPANGLDVEALEADLVLSLLPEYPGLVTSVTCPKPLDPAPGDAAICEAQVGSDLAPVELTFGDEQGVVTAAIVERLVNAAEIERLVAQRFVDDLALTTTVRCGQPVRVLFPGGVVSCSAIDHRGVERVLNITVGTDGALDIALV